MGKEVGTDDAAISDTENQHTMAEVGIYFHFSVTAEEQEDMDRQVEEHTTGDLQSELVPQPQLSKKELIRLRRSLAELECKRITKKSQGTLIATRTSPSKSCKMK